MGSSFLIAGIASNVIVFFTDFRVILSYAAVMGVFSGLCVVIMTPLMCSSVSIDKLGSAIGLLILIHNIDAALTSFIAGTMYELTGSYGNALRLLGSVYVLGAAVYAIEIKLITKSTEL